MHFRPLTLSDLSAAMKLETSLPKSPAWFPVDEKYLTAIIRSGLTFGVFEQNTFIGKVGFWSEHQGEYEVDGMILNEQYRGKGIGKQLLSYALEELVKKTHPKKVYLFTYPKNTPAIALYEQCGFIQKELIPNKYGPGMDRIRMEKIIV